MDIKFWYNIFCFLFSIFFWFGVRDFVLSLRLSCGLYLVLYCIDFLIIIVSVVGIYCLLWRLLVWIVRGISWCLLFIGIFLNVSVGIVIFEGGNFVFNIWIIMKCVEIFFCCVFRMYIYIYNVLGKKWVDYILSVYI